jgi:hypothetical protein
MAVRAGQINMRTHRVGGAHCGQEISLVWEPLIGDEISKKLDAADRACAIYVQPEGATDVNLMIRGNFILLWNAGSQSHCFTAKETLAFLC